MKIRRVIVGTGSDGKAQVLSDDSAPRAIDFKQVPGFSPTLLWATPAIPEVGKGQVGDPTPTAESWVPGPGGTRLMTVRFPPDSSMMRADFDPAAFGAEFGAGMPGLAEKFEMDSPGMHTTDSVDYDVVLEGEITLELDGGKEVRLKKHDVVVQNGNRHAWRNKSSEPAVMLFVLIGANRKK